MALAVAHVGGNITSGHTGNPCTSDSWTSTSGSLLVAIGIRYSNTGVPVDGDMTDSNGNTWLLAKGNTSTGAVVGIGAWYQLGGTRGASHTVSYDTPAGSVTQSIAVIEITGHDTSTPFDTTTAAVAADAVTPYLVTAAAAISGNQIAIYGCGVDGGGSQAWTNPSGYTTIINQPNGNTEIAFSASYKLNETGTPAVSSSWSGTNSTGAEVFVTFKEAGAGGNVIVPFRRRQQPATVVR